MVLVCVKEGVSVQVVVGDAVMDELLVEDPDGLAVFVSDRVSVPEAEAVPVSVLEGVVDAVAEGLLVAVGLEVVLSDSDAEGVRERLAVAMARRRSRNVLILTF